MKPLTIALSLILLSSCSQKQELSLQKSPAENHKEIITSDHNKDLIAKDISYKECKSLMANGSVKLIDVRTPEEYHNGTIENAENINFLDDDFIEKMSQINKSQSIIVFCQAGGRSSKAMKLLKENGFEKIYNLQGGYGSVPAN